jgi:hypothetical protein
VRQQRYRPTPSNKTQLNALFSILLFSSLIINLFIKPPLRRITKPKLTLYHTHLTFSLCFPPLRWRNPEISSNGEAQRSRIQWSFSHVLGAPPLQMSPRLSPPALEVAFPLFLSLYRPSPRIPPVRSTILRPSPATLSPLPPPPPRSSSWSGLCPNR